MCYERYPQTKPNFFISMIGDPILASVWGRQSVLPVIERKYTLRTRLSGCRMSQKSPPPPDIILKETNNR